MVVLCHQLNGHEFEQALGDGEGQGSLVCCSPQGCKESDMTEQLNNNNYHNQWFLSFEYLGITYCACYEPGPLRYPL